MANDERPASDPTPTPCARFGLRMRNIGTQSGRAIGERSGAAAFEMEIIGGAKDVLTYTWNHLAGRYNASDSNVTGQTQAVETYLKLLAPAYHSGKIDPIRWGIILTRVSRLTGIPVETLHEHYRKPAEPRRRFTPAQPVASHLESAETVGGAEAAGSEPEAPSEKSTQNDSAAPRPTRPLS